MLAGDYAVAKVTRRDFIKMAGIGVAAFGGGALTWNVLNASNEKSGIKVPLKSSPYTWVRFLAGPNESILTPLTTGLDGHLYRYRVREVVNVRGQAPANLAQTSSIIRIETSVPPSFDESSSPTGSLVIQFHGVRQNLHYTSDAQSKELDARAIKEVEPSEHTTAVLIPIAKSDEWWKLAQDQRQAYFQKTDKHEGHTAIGLHYVDRVFRKLYHSRFLGAGLDYDFLTYFEFKDEYEKDFKTLLAELRDTNVNPEWAYVNLEYEIWMTKIG